MVVTDVAVEGAGRAVVGAGATPGWSAPPRRRPWIIPTVVGVGVAAATAYTAVLDPSTDQAFPLCPLKYVTGADCPACGGLRAVHALSRGDVVGAADHHVLLVMAVPFLLVGYGLWLAHTLGAKVPRVRLSGRAIGALVALLLVFAVARNLPIPGHDFLNSARS